MIEDLHALWDREGEFVAAYRDVRADRRQMNSPRDAARLDDFELTNERIVIVHPYRRFRERCARALLRNEREAARRMAVDGERTRWCNVVLRARRVEELADEIDGRR